jgi:hypothetical protein
VGQFLPVQSSFTCNRLRARRGAENSQSAINSDEWMIGRLRNALDLAS